MSEIPRVITEQNMARMHSHRHGKSHSTRPTSKRTPSWISFSSEELTTAIVKLAKEGLTASQIGQRIRDEYNVPLVKAVMGKSIAEVLRENKASSSRPEDLERLLKRAQHLQSHLKVHRGDRKNIRSLELLEARIHRLAKYYKSKEILPEDWKYAAVVAQLA